MSNNELRCVRCGTAGWRKTESENVCPVCLRNPNARYPWQCTIDEWLGPRMIGGALSSNYTERHRQAIVQEPTPRPRRAFEHYWVEYTPTGPLIYATETSTEVLGALRDNEHWSLAPELRGKGLAVRVLETMHRYGRNPDEWIKGSLHLSLNADSLKCYTRTYQLACRNAAARGVEVEPRILEASERALERLSELMLGDAESRAGSKLQKMRLQNRLRLIRVSSGFVAWLQSAVASNGPQVARLEARREELQWCLNRVKVED